ncbi:MAG TPA: hypothetical protein VF139_12080 [Candidatus Polarisedimenticolaceae bacterium]
MSQRHDERRRNDRFRFDAEEAARFRFRFPDEDGALFESKVRDISGSGLSFLVVPGLPTLEAGDLLREVEVQIGGSPIRGEMVILHITPEFEPGATCGGLFYPRSDDDLLAVRHLLAELAQARA